MNLINLKYDKCTLKDLIEDSVVTEKAPVLFNKELELLEFIVEGVVVVVIPLGFLSIDNNSAEESFTFEAEDEEVVIVDFKPVAAEAKLPKDKNSN